VRVHSYSNISTYNSINYVSFCGKVTRSIIPVPAPMHACSACAGDYEDPERTAWSDASEEEGAEETSADHAEQSAPSEAFPVREK
jgi:hypothetical protein